MELKNYVHIFRRYLWLIILFTTLTTLLTTALVFLVPPTYKSTTTLLVNQASSETINLNDIMTSERLAKTYAEIITKRTILTKVIDELSLETTYDELIKQIDVEIIRDTQLISVSVKNRNADEAAQVADLIAQKFADEVILLQGERDRYNTVSIVEKAFPATKADSPKKTLSIGLAFVLSLMSITGLIFLFEYLDDTFKDEFDVKEYLNLPHLGTISYIRDIHRQPGKLITLLDSHNPVVESMREIRTNIQFSQPEKGNKSFVLTSSIPSEGKSQTVANLGVIMAQAGYKTVIIDADLHRPTQHDIFNLTNNYGLSDVLTTSELPAHLTQPTEINGLSIITSGSFLPNPAEWLGSSRMYELIEKLKEQKFHTIIFDTPPIGLVTDAALLSSMVDGTIIVIEGGRTHRNEVQKSYEAIKKVGGEVIGTVLTYKKPGKEKKGYYYYDSNHDRKSSK